MSVKPLFLAGKFVQTDAFYKVTNPYNHQSVAEVCLADNGCIETAIKSAYEVSPITGKLSSLEKYNILQLIASEINRRKNEISRIISTECGKPLKYSLIEVERAIQTFNIAAEESKRIYGEVISLDWFSGGLNKEGIINYFPIGVVYGITPFNFPLNLVAHKVAPAIASGCPIILKPAPRTPLTALVLAEIIAISGWPEGALSVLPMSNELAGIPLGDRRIKMVSFTGSPQIGWEIKNKSGNSKVTLELGGNAGVIITPTANVETAVNKCVTGSFSYSGQVCIHTQRIYVHKSIFKLFLDEFINKTKKLKCGDPLLEETDFSVLIDDAATERVASWIEEAIASGAKLVYGGLKDKELLPTILTNTNSNMKVCSKEVFGPVVMVESYEEFKDAVAQINNSDFGLQAGIFTNEISEMNYGYQNIHAGAILINEIPTFRADHMPYGGIKNSGIGREGVRYAMMDMMEPKLLVKERGV